MSTTPEKRPPRIDLAEQATLIDSQGGEIAVTIRDLSQGGFRLDASEVLAAGERVRIRTDRYGDFPAEIRWVKGFEAGGVFLEPVNLPDA